MGEEAESLRAVLDLHGVLSHVDPARWSAESAGSRREKLTAIQTRLESAAADDDALSALLAALREHLPESDERDAWLAFRKAVTPAWMALAASFRARGVQLPSLRPTNYVRNVWHVMNTSVAMAVLLLAPAPEWVIVAAGCFCFPFWFLEWIRRRRPALNERIVHFFRHIVHPHEAVKVNSRC